MRLTKAQRKSVHTMFGGRCAYCGSELAERGWHADHVEHVGRMDWAKRFGADRPPDYPERDKIENIFPACAPCNIDKHTFNLEQWRRKLQDACNVLARNQPTYRHALRFGLVSETGAAVVFYFERLQALQEQPSSKHAAAPS